MPSARRIFRLVSIRQFMPFSTLWIVRSATRALRASWAWVMRRFSRSSRTRFGCRALLNVTGVPQSPREWGDAPFFRRAREFLYMANGVDWGGGNAPGRQKRGDPAGMAASSAGARTAAEPARRALPTPIATVLGSRAARRFDRPDPARRLRGRPGRRLLGCGTHRPGARAARGR